MATLQRIFKELKKEKKLAQKEVERLEEAISTFGKLVGKRAVQTEKTVRRVRRTMSAAARKRISQAQKARWAKWRRG